MKQRFTLLDIKAVVLELNTRLTNTFIQNFYSIQQRLLYIKFSNKDILLIEPGYRIHLTKSCGSEISHFCKKLREKCRNTRVHRIYQFENDRIVIIDLQRAKLVIEFFSAGNVIILDEADEIIEILRPVEGLGMMRGNKYVFNPVELDLTFEAFRDSENLSEMLPFEAEYIDIVTQRMEEELGTIIRNLKDEKYRNGITEFFQNLKMEIEGLTGFGEVTIKNKKPNQLFAFKTVTDGIDISRELSSSIKSGDNITTDNITTDNITTDNIMANNITTDNITTDNITTDNITTDNITTDNIMANNITTDNIMANNITTDNIKTDNITTDNIMANNITTDNITTDNIKTDDKTTISDNKEVDITLKNMTKNLSIATLPATDKNLKKLPINLRDKEEIESLITKYKGRHALHFPSFNEAAEYYFLDNLKKKKAATDKTQNIKNAQMKYIDKLESQAGELKETAEILEENREFVGEILNIFKKVFSAKMEWGIFETFWEEEKKQENPHANAIKTFDLASKSCIIQLEDRMIELDLSISLNKNIEKYFTQRRKAIDKSEKTKVAIEKVSEKIGPKKTAVPAQKREAYWFEKFNFFISTDNQLVIGGKNAQQNELIVKKYMEAGDLYFHGDVQGASSVICKGRSENSINEAAYMAMCMSKCWEEGVMRPVFYVEPEQVTKTTPSGEYITKGSFMIWGKKTVLNPYRLEYGVGVMFKLEEARDVLEFSNNPGAGDKILHAMPVAAPWICVKDYKYKVRLCPGGDKKSRVCQDIKSGFDNQSEGNSDEKFVKSIGLDEYMGVVPGKSKIAKPLK